MKYFLGLNKQIKTTYNTVEILCFMIVFLLILAPSSKIIVINFMISIILFLILIIIRKLKLYLPKWILYLFFLYLPLLLYGIIENSDFHIDFKFHLFLLISFVIYGTILKKYGLGFSLYIIFYINIIILFIYLFIFLFDIPREINFFARGTAASGYGYRVEGPSLVSFLIFPLFYLTNRKSWDYKLMTMFFSALICCILNGSMQYLMLVLIVYSLVLIKKPKYLLLLPIIFFSLLQTSIIIFSPFINDSYKTKLTYINNPWEYPTVQHRLETLEIMLDQTTNSFLEILFGSGVGVKSTYYEVNEVSSTLSRERTFLEIDNGFFYVYHRAGLIGIIAFVLFHLYIFLFKTHPFNFRLAVFVIFVITNLLSIHYFTVATFAIFIVLSIQKPSNIHIGGVDKHYLK